MAVDTNYSLMFLLTYTLTRQPTEKFAKSPFPFMTLNLALVPFKHLNGVLNGSPFKVVNGHSNAESIQLSERSVERDFERPIQGVVQNTIHIQEFERSPIQSSICTVV
jgi:hypothetical protein